MGRRRLNTTSNSEHETRRWNGGTHSAREVMIGSGITGQGKILSSSSWDGYQAFSTLCLSFTLHVDIPLWPLVCLGTPGFLYLTKGVVTQFGVDLCLTPAAWISSSRRERWSWCPRPPSTGRSSMNSESGDEEQEEFNRLLVSPSRALMKLFLRLPGKKLEGNSYIHELNWRIPPQASLCFAAWNIFGNEKEPPLPLEQG